MSAKREFGAITVFCALVALGAWAPGSSASHSVAITAGPSGTVTSSAARFEYTSSLPAQFYCSLDGGPSTPCSPASATGGSISYSGLSNGAHRFRVVALRPRELDIASAARSWTVAVPRPLLDLFPPDTSITAGPPRRTASNTALFQLSATEPASFACALDAGPFMPCPSPFALDNLQAGGHRLRARATDAAGNVDPSPAERSWTVGSTPFEVKAPKRRLRIRGPVVLRAKDMRRAVRARQRKPKHGEDELEEGEGAELATPAPREAPDQKCVPPGCREPAEGSPHGGGRRALARAAAPGSTPGLTSGPYVSGASANDPAIAASSSHLLVGNNSVLRFMTKSGKLLDKDKQGNAFTGRIEARDFFRPLADPKAPAHNLLNKGLNLPAGLECDPEFDPYSPDLKAKFKTRDCLTTFYDTRVIFDDFRKRFWIVSQVRNASVGTFQELSDPKQRVGRRTKLAIAVSSSEDPRDKWYMYLASAEWGLGDCNDIGSDPGPPPLCPGGRLRPGDAADYPSIGISEHHVVISTNVGNTNPWNAGKKDGQQYAPGYTRIIGASADDLASGKSSPYSYDFGRPKVFFGAAYSASGYVDLDRGVAPAVQHGDSSNRVYLVANDSESDELLLLDYSSGPKYAGSLSGVAVPVSPFSGPNDLPQRPLAPIDDPRNVQVTNLHARPLNSVARGNDVYATWMDCKEWQGLPEGTCATGIRVVGLDAEEAVTKPGAKPFVDRTFGKASPADPAGTGVVSYGNPGIEIASGKKLVAVYNRSSPNVFFEARYSAWFLKDETDIRPSALLMPGSSNVGPNQDHDPDAGDAGTFTHHLDTAGTASDPVDGGVWVYHAFGDRGPEDTQGFTSFAFGKVFGRSRPDRGVYWVKAKVASGLLKVKGSILNFGDRLAGRARAVAVLRGPHGFRRTLRRFRVPRLRPGRRRGFSFSVPLAGLSPGRYTLKLKLRAKGRREYSRRNNVLRRSFRVGNR